MKEKIIIAEDDESIRSLLEVALSSHGYCPVGFGSAKEALAEIETEAPDLVIFDIMMDGLDGLEAVRRMRQLESCRHIPVIMLTAKDTELDKIIGLDAGADDYITKPFSVLELCARVRAQLRRMPEQKDASEASVIHVSGALSLNTEAREVLLAGQAIELTFKEFELLKTLMASPNRALTRTELFNQIWGDDYYGETRTLDIHIGSLRQKLRDSAPDRDYIKTIRGVGYRFVGEE